MEDIKKVFLRIAIGGVMAFSIASDVFCESFHDDSNGTQNDQQLENSSASHETDQNAIVLDEQSLSELTQWLEEFFANFSVEETTALGFLHIVVIMQPEETNQTTAGVGEGNTTQSNGQNS